MGGKESVGFMQWGSPNVACLVLQWMQRKLLNTFINFFNEIF